MPSSNLVDAPHNKLYNTYFDTTSVIHQSDEVIVFLQAYYGYIPNIEINLGKVIRLALMLWGDCQTNSSNTRT